MAIFSLNELRAAAPAELQGLSDDALLRDYSQRVGKSFEETADYFGFKPRGTLAEMGRQAVGGAVVDLPKMFGQGLQYTGVAPQLGKELVEGAEERAVDYVPDMRGRGLVGQAGVLGARAVAPMAPAIAASMLPGGQVAAPLVAAGLFGTSSAQETYEKLKAEGASEQDAIAAARRVGLIQGPLEGAATAVGLRAAKGLAPVLGIGGKTTAGVAGELTETAVAKPFLKGMALNAVVQPGTEVAQDLGTYAVEQAYGAKAEDPYEIAKQSALGGVGLTMILGPLSLGGHIARARKAEVLQAALSEDAPSDIRAQAIKAVTTEARRQGVAESDIGTWFNQQLEVEKAFNERVRQEALTKTVDLMGKEAQELPFMQGAQPFSSLDQQRQFEEGMAGVNLQTPFSSIEQQRGFEQDLMGIRDRKVAEVGQQYQDLVGRKTSGLMAAQDAGQEWQQLQAKKESGLAAATAVGDEFQEQRVERLKRQFNIDDIGQEWQKLAADLPQPVSTGLTKMQRTALLGPKGKRLKQTSSPFQVTEQQAPSSSILPQAPAYAASILPQDAGQAAVPISERPAQVSPPLGAASAVQPTTPAVVGASSKAPKRGPKTPQAKQAKAQGQESTTVSTADVDSEADVAAAQSAIDELGLRPLAGNSGSQLQASVKGGTIKVGGRPSYDAPTLAKASGAFISGKMDKEAKTPGGKLAQAARDFGAKYLAYLNAAGTMIPTASASTTRFTLKKTPKFPQVGEEAQASARADQYVGNAQKKWNEAQAALGALGEAAGNNAKNVEVMIRLIKDKIAARKADIDEKMAAAGEDGDQLQALVEEMQNLEKLDLGLAQGWASAKRGIFRNDADILDVRGGDVRTSKEEQKQGFTQPLVRAAEYGASLGPNSPVQKGFMGVMNYIRGKGTPFERMIAKAVSEVFKNTSNPPSVVFAEGKAQFDPKTNTITMSPTASPEVALHEALHAALQWYVHTKPNDPMVRQLLKAVEKVVKYDTGKLSPKAAEVQAVLAKLVKGKRELDAVLELISYGNTLVEFRKALEAMPSKGTPESFVKAATDVWNMILATVRRMLGLKSNTVAGDVIMGSFRLLERAANTKYESASGKILEAAVQTNKPVSNAKIAEALGVSEQDYSRWNKSNVTQLQATQRMFELVGLSEANMKKFVGTAGDKTRAFINKNFPGAEVVLSWINARYNVSETVSRIMDNFKLNKGIGYQYAEDLANVISRRPAEEVNALFAYMDGDKKALDKLPDSMKLKAIADKLKGWFDMYVAELTPVEQQWFNSRKFSETLLFPETTEQVAGGTFGLGHINDVLGIKRESSELVQEWFRKDDNGDLILSGDMYRVFEKNNATSAGGLIPAGFISASRFAELGGVNPMGVTVDTSRKWIYEGFKNGNHTFMTNTTAKEKIANEKADDVANALRNTIAALANNYASKHFIKSIYDMGRGDNSHAQIAFDSLDDVNAFMNKGVPADQRVLINEKMVLPVSREISRSPQTKSLYRQTGTWVKLPERSPVYGELSGKYIPGPVWNAMGDMNDRQPLIPLRAVNNTMRWFKKSKTVWNPGTHVTNAASNVTVAMLHDISFGTIADAAKILAKYEANPKALTKPELELMMAFRDSGAMLADYSSAEVKEALYKAHEENLRGGEDVSVMRRVAGWMSVEKAKAEWLQAQAKKVGKGVDYVDNLTTQMYAGEDNIFRMAAFLKTAGALQQRAGLKTPTAEMMREAGMFARKAFGDYDIDSKAVKIARQTAMPFVSWFYAMAPVIGRIAVYEPWKLANVVMVYMILEAAMAGAAGGDDEELRKQGPESIRERMFGSVGPYMNVRIPFMGDEENPVYYKLGDYFPLATFTRGQPNGLMGQSWIPASLTPSGPFVSGILGMVGGVDPYTGKSLHKPTDTELQKLWTSTKFAYDTATIPLINSRNIGKVDDIIEGKTGITGNEPSSLPIARAFGMKFYDFNVTEQAAINDMVVKRIEKDFKSAMTKAKRDEYRKAYPDYDELDATLEELRTRMDKEVTKARGGAEE